MSQKITVETKEIICGIVMPISEIDECNENHWNDVLIIIKEAISEVGYVPNLVSNADDVGVIHKRIVQNLYDNPIVVCDISGKNPNVMFELGLRLAFDKPTIIIKDDKTSYSFDTSAIEHIEYPRDLRFNKIKEFKFKLAEKINHTYIKYLQDPSNFSTFLKHFGEFKIAKIEQTEVLQQESIIEELKNLRSLILNTNKINNTIHNNDVERNNIKQVPIEELGISASTFKALKSLKLNTITDILMLDLSALNAIKYNREIVDEIQKYLNRKLKEVVK